MCDNLCLRWRPPLRWNWPTLPWRRIQRREWFGLLPSVQLRRSCKKEWKILLSMTANLCTTDLHITVFVVFHTIKMDTEQLQLLSTTSTVDWYLGSKCTSFETKHFQTVRVSQTCTQLWLIYLKPVNTDASSTSWSVYVTIKSVPVFLLSSWSPDELFSCDIDKQWRTASFESLCYIVT